MMPGGDHVGDRLRPRFSTSSNDAMITLRALRLGQQLHRHLGDHDQHALGADGEREQVVARRVGRLAAELHRLAVDGEAAHAAGRCARVRPYFRQCTPPEFSATLPPMVQAIWLDGSGA